MPIDLPAEVLGLAVALGAGLLIGVEREQHKSDHAGRMAAGVRTCALLALTGATAALLGPVALAIAGAFVALAVVASYWGTQGTDPGLTTEVALVLTFLVGVLAVSRPGLAAGVAVVATLLLQSKDLLHRFSKQILTERELDDALLPLASGLVILPILPAEPIGPFEGLDLRRLWALVVLVMAINALGYVAVRAFGARLGLPVTGFASGFVSSAATIARMGHRARQAPELLGAAAMAGTLSNLPTVLVLVLLTLTVLPSLFLALLLPLALAGAAMLVWSLALGLSYARSAPPVLETPHGRPFHFGHALAFAALIAAVLAGATLLEHWLGERGAMLAAAAVGLADAHAATISIAELAAGGALTVPAAALGVLLALTANTLTKAVVAWTGGGKAYALRLWPGLGLMLAAAWGGWLLAR